MQPPPTCTAPAITRPPRNWPGRPWDTPWKPSTIRKRSRRTGRNRYRLRQHTLLWNFRRIVGRCDSASETTPGMPGSKELQMLIILIIVLVLVFGGGGGYYGYGRWGAGGGAGIGLGTVLLILLVCYLLGLFR